MSDQKSSSTFKSLLYSALSFTFSDKKQLLFSILSFMLPFLLFFPILAISLSVQSSFLVEYQALHSLEQDEQDSVGYYFSSSYLTNTTNIPSNLLAEIDRDIADIIYYSNLGDYINGYLSDCDAQLQYYSEGIIQNANMLFIQNESLQQISKYFEIKDAIPNSFNECILVQKTDLSEYTTPEYSYSIGDNISILPFAYESTGKDDFDIYETLSGPDTPLMPYLGYMDFLIIVASNSSCGWNDFNMQMTVYDPPYSDTSYKYNFGDSAGDNLKIGIW